MQKDIQTVLDYWFGPIEDGMTQDNRNRLWFGGDAETDADIKQRFEPLLLRAEQGELDDWQTTPRGTLALIILLDQFPLNIYRRSARAYDFEEHGVACCLYGLEHQQDQALSFVEKLFFYLPLEHSENLDHQERCVMLFNQLVKESPESLKPRAQGALDYAIKHRDIVARFGHFPHRN